MKNNNFLKDLFVLDMANNHFGNLSHAKKIVKSFSVVTCCEFLTRKTIFVDFIM